MILKIFRYPLVGCALLTISSCFSLGYFVKSENLAYSPQFAPYLNKEIELKRPAWIEIEGICVNGHFVQDYDEACEITESPRNFTHPIKKGTRLRLDKVIHYFKGGLIDKEHILLTLSSSKLKMFGKQVRIHYYWYCKDPKFSSIFSMPSIK